MEMQLPKAVQPGVTPASQAAPAVPFAAKVHTGADSVMFGSRGPQFGAGGGDARGNIFVRFFNWVRNALHLGMDNLEKATPEVKLNAEHNELVTKIEEVKEELGLIIGEHRVLKQELEAQVLKEARERQEADAALAALERAQEQHANDPVRLKAFQDKALKEVDEADRELKLVRTKEEQVKQAERQARQAQRKIAQYDEQLKEAIARLEQGKQDIAEIAALEKLRDMQRILDEANGDAVGLTNSTGTLLRELAVKKEALKAQLNDGRTDEEIDAEIEVEEEIAQQQKQDRLNAILAARKAKREGGQG